MPRNGSGNYDLPINSWNPAINGVSATPADWQALANDMAAAIQGSVASDGQTPMSADLAMAGYRLTGAGAPTGTGMSLRWEQLIRGADIPSAATITIPLEGQFFAVTGSTAITSIAATIAGRLVYLKLDAGIVLTHSASLIMPAGVNVTTQANDIVAFLSVSAGVWRCISYPRYAASDHAGAVEPTIRWPYMTWADTGNDLLKRRNAADSAWVTIGALLSHGSASLAFKVAPSTAANEAVAQSQVFGVGQTLQDVTASRSFGVTYTNSTGRPKWVAIGATATGGGFAISATVGGVAVVYDKREVASEVVYINFIVPAGATYAAQDGGVLTNLTWMELI